VRFSSGVGPSAKGVEMQFDTSPAFHGQALRWSVAIPPRTSWELCSELLVSVGVDVVEPRFTCASPEAPSLPATRLASWRATLPRITSDNSALDDTIRRTSEDLGALRIYDPEHPDTPILAAGAPWFMTVFGRDSLLTAWMTLLADPTLARGVLETLARFQGDDIDPVTEEEPGKILHEIRFGSAGDLSLRTGDRYYGSIDATPLFVMLLGELRRWDLADDIVSSLLPHADRALAWIEEFGDRDGDGFVEYDRSSERGLVNQGWKDSWDAIRCADGSLARPPIALCEAQGYVYAAYVARAHFAREAGDSATYDRYRRMAIELRTRFNDQFWLEDRGWYALGLDADKQPIDALASNVGHCLWTGIVDPARAGDVAARLLSDDLFSGWGVRTLATSMTAYNPVSYHNGSVWPHDTTIAALGMRRYGLEDAFLTLATGLFEAVLTFDAVRMPELFCGFSRRLGQGPIRYPVACSPQAWSAGVVFQLLSGMLGLAPDAKANRLTLDRPRLPPWLRWIELTGLQVSSSRVSLRVTQVREGAAVELMEREGDVEIIVRR
jgi:glycogen debranching enzyme